MNDITELRAHLFDTLKELKNKDNPMDIERAKAVSDIAQTIINSAKVEVDHMKIAGGSGSGFIGQATKQISQTPTGEKVVEGNTTTHKLK